MLVTEHFFVGLTISFRKWRFDADRVLEAAGLLDAAKRHEEHAYERFGYIVACLSRPIE